MKILQNIKNFFSKPFKAPFEDKLVKMEDDTTKPKRMPTGGSNGLLTAQERLHATTQMKKKKRNRKASKQQRQSRNINHKAH